MKIEIQLDESYREPKIIIQTDQMTEEIRLLLQRLGSTAPGIVGTDRQNSWLRSAFSVYTPHPERYMPRRTAANIHSACACMKRKRSWTPARLSAFHMRNSSI